MSGEPSDRMGDDNVGIANWRGWKKCTAGQSGECCASWTRGSASMADAGMEEGGQAVVPSSSDQQLTPTALLAVKMRTDGGVSAKCG